MKKFNPIGAWIHIGSCMNYLSISCSLGGVGGRAPLYLPLQSTWPPAYLFSHFLNPITRASDFVGTKQALCQLALPTSIILRSCRKISRVRYYYYNVIIHLKNSSHKQFVFLSAWDSTKALVGKERKLHITAG